MKNSVVTAMSLVCLYLGVISHLYADQKFVYTVNKFLVGNATLVYEVKDTEHLGAPALMISTHGKATVFGSVVQKGSSEAITYPDDYATIMSSSCETPQPEQRQYPCIHLNLFENGYFLIKPFEGDKARLESLEEGAPGVALKDVFADNPEFDPHNDRIFDTTSMLLKVRQLLFSADHPSYTFFVNYFDLVRKVKLTLARELPKGLQEIKITLENGQPADFNYNLPQKLELDTKKNVVTKIFGRSKDYGSFVAKLDLRESKF